MFVKVELLKDGATLAVFVTDALDGRPLKDCVLDTIADFELGPSLGDTGRVIAHCRRFDDGQTGDRLSSFMIDMAPDDPGPVRLFDRTHAPFGGEIGAAAA